MLKLLSIDRFSGVTFSSFILIISIFIGALAGHLTPSTGIWLGNRVDYTLLTLVSLLFFGLRFDSLLQALRQPLFLIIALVANFVIIPLIAYGITSQLLSVNPLFMLGLFIYFISPCTDWFLSFTRLARGNVALGTALIPINMTAQLLLYPLYLQWFTQNTVQLEAGFIAATLLQWFLIPLIVAVVAHQCLRLLLKPRRFKLILEISEQTTLWVTALLVLQIFASNISVILEHQTLLTWVLLAVFSFFLVTFLLSEFLSYFFRLRYAERSLLTMTMAARNAPLMLAVTITTLPDQPLVYAALVIGMLVEMPHLTVLRFLMLSTQQAHSHQESSSINTTRTTNA